MTERFTARLPDGTDSRAGWILWMISASLAVWLLMLVARIISYSLISIGGLGAGLPDAMYSAATAVLNGSILAAMLIGSTAFATPRLLMPRATWFGVALPPAVSWVFAVQGLLTGEYHGLLYALALSVGVVTAWVLDRRRRLT